MRKLRESGADRKAGEVECLKHDEESDTWVTRVKWGVGVSKEEVGLTGWDVLVSGCCCVEEHRE
jgi:hypothetical protein